MVAEVGHVPMARRGGAMGGGEWAKIGFPTFLQDQFYNSSKTEKKLFVYGGGSLDLRSRTAVPSILHNVVPN